MRRTLLTLTVLCSSLLASAQGISIDYLMQLPQTLVNRYKQDTMKRIVLNMTFGSDSLLNPSALLALKGKVVEQIDLVYTEYREVPDFNQPELNRNRLGNLQKKFKPLFENGSTRWNFIAQTGCKNSKDCQGYFHGFVIYYKNYNPKEESLADISMLNNVFTQEQIGTEEKKVVKRVKRREYYLPVSKTKREKGITYTRKGIWGRERVVEKDTEWKTVSKPIYKLVVNEEEVKPFRDSSVLRTLERNNWKNMAVVVDVTQSMSPYLVQMMLWLSLDTNQERTRYIVFFNDGDRKTDRQKRIGSTGGLYGMPGGSPVEVLAKMKQAIDRGDGGDNPENDLEAVLHAIEKCPECTEVVLIADNQADCRDFSLLPKIKKPLHIILCGSNGFPMSSQRMVIARNTRGSVHTMESDITNLAELKEGQKIEINGIYYFFSDGTFYPLKKLGLRGE